MKSGYMLHFKNRREGKTNYRFRLNMLKSGKPRLIVRVTNTKVTAQIVNYDISKAEETTQVYADSRELKKHGWKHGLKNISAAYLTGYLLAKKSLGKENVKDVIFEMGMRTPTKGAKVFAVLKGALDAGMVVPFSDVKFPSEDRILGKHIKDGIAKDIEVVKAKMSKVKS